jgi:hypothetical protein
MNSFAIKVLSMAGLSAEGAYTVSKQHDTLRAIAHEWVSKLDKSVKWWTFGPSDFEGICPKYAGKPTAYDAEIICKYAKERFDGLQGHWY